MSNLSTDPKILLSSIADVIKETKADLTQEAAERADEVKMQLTEELKSLRTDMQLAGQNTIAIEHVVKGIEKSVQTALNELAAELDVNVQTLADRIDEKLDLTGAGVHKTYLWMELQDSLRAIDEWVDDINTAKPAFVKGRNKTLTTKRLDYIKHTIAGVQR